MSSAATDARVRSAKAGRIWALIVASVASIACVACHSQWRRAVSAARNQKKRTMALDAPFGWPRPLASSSYSEAHYEAV